MLHGKPRLYRFFVLAFAAGVLLLSLNACKTSDISYGLPPTVVKQYPAGKPFVYKTNIKLKGKFTTDEKNNFLSRLNNQLDDSMRVRTVKKVFFQVMKKPPVYYPENAGKSVNYMKSLLKSIGYFRATITFDTLQLIKKKNKKPEQIRTAVNFYVTPGKLLKLDSISFNIKHPELHALTIANQKETFLKKTGAFAQPVISNELDRLVDIYRNNGYMRFTREELIGLWDTLDVSLLRPTFDPFEKIQQLEKLRQRRENPTANLEIRLRPGLDTNRLTKFFIGDISIFPDFNQDTVSFSRKEIYTDGSKIVYYRPIFKPGFLPKNVYFKHGELYNQKNYFKTINRFNELGAWRLVNIEQVPRAGIDTVDFTIRLTPADKLSFSANLEGSINTGNYLAGNLFGLGLNLGLLNRNFARVSNQSNTNIRFGTELNVSKGQQFIQTRQFVIGHNIYFPRLLPNFSGLPAKYKENIKTVFTINAARTERRNLFDLTTFNAAWGYDLQWKNKLFSLKIPNIEFSNLQPKEGLKELFIINPSLHLIFNDGLVISGIANYFVTGGKNNVVNNLRLNVEESGLLTGNIRTKQLDSNLYRFVKLDAEFRRSKKMDKKELAFRIFAGAGVALESTVHPDKQKFLPFFKQYFAGGPNSMRAWSLRNLGPGSTIKTFDGRRSPDRFGDIQFEMNAEFRFYLTSIAGAKINGALFTDIGNVWFLRPHPDFPNGDFKFENFARDLAVGVGTGLRIDFDFFLIRLDYAFKARNPSPDDIAKQYKWFYGWDMNTWKKGQLQLGIGYPF